MASTTPTHREDRAAVNAGIGHNVRTLRAAAGLTYAQLGAQLGLGVNSVRGIELGERHLRFTEALQLAQLFGVPLHALAESTAAQVAASSSVSIRVTAATSELSAHAARLQADADRLAQLVADLVPAPLSRAA